MAAAGYGSNEIFEERIKLFNERLPETLDKLVENDKLKREQADEIKDMGIQFKTHGEHNINDMEGSISDDVKKSLMSLWNDTAQEVLNKN